MSEFNIHNIRFYDYQPEAIHCIAYNNDNKLLALSRADGSIELWNCCAKPFKQKTLIGTNSSSVESLVWCVDRLFSSGLNSFILEYDIHSFSVKNKVSVTGGPTWCLALSPNKQILAAGTEEGYICLFNVNEEGLLYYKTIQKQKLRILSLGWHSDSEHLVTGSVNYVNLISIQNEQQTLQFPVANVSSSKDTIVWCVALLEDKTIVTGDSRGKTCFWDGNFGTLISGLQTHQADVLTMQVMSDCCVIYVAGIDQVIVELRLVDSRSKQGRRMMWVKSFQRRIHTHDIRSLALTKEGKLFSGGVDTYLAFSFYPPKTAMKFPATPPRGYVSVAHDSNCVLLGYKDRLELWKMGTRSLQDSRQPNRFCSLEKDRVKLAEIELKPKARLKCCAVSPRSKRFAFVATSPIKIFNIDNSKDGEDGCIEKLNFVNRDDAVLPSCQILWLTDDKLLSASFSSSLQILFVNEDNEVSVERTLVLPTESVTEIMKVSKGGRFVAILDSTNVVTVFDLSETDCKGKTLPRVKVAVTALAVDEESVFVAYSNMTLCEYYVSTGLCTRFGRDIRQAGTELSKSNNVVLNISLDDENRIFMHSVSYLYVIERTSSGKPNFLNDSRASKSRKLVDERNPSSDNFEMESNDSFSGALKKSSFGGFKMSAVSRSNHILYFSHLKGCDLISIDKNPIWLLDSLPPALKVKKFGAT